MGAVTDVSAFSDFVLRLHERSRTEDPAALLHWSIAELADILHADCGWAGWADLWNGNDVEVCGAVAYGLPDDFQSFWDSIRREDLLARDVIATGSAHACYDRQGRRHTDGMIALSDRYNIRKMTVVCEMRADGEPSLFMSFYRGDRGARPLDDAETRFVRCAIDHLARLSARRCEAESGRAALLVNDEGRIVFAPPDSLRFLRERWPGARANYLPFAFTSPAAEPTRCVTDGVVVQSRRLGGYFSRPFHLVHLRPAAAFDTLTPRERQVADEIAKGRTHKEIARLLAMSPNTVRNHTQTILGKLGLSNRAMLASMTTSSAAS